jgi:RNA polymerase sigma-70 factor (ECF subfamily)
MMPERPTSHRDWVLSVLDQYEGRLARYAGRLTGDEDAARDVVQHAFLKLCDESPASVGQRVAAWLFTVCHNRAMDLRRQSARFEPLVEDDHAATSHAATNGHAAFSREADPAAAAETKDASEVLQRVLAGLPCKQRSVIDLWSEGFGYREISQITGQSENYVRVLAHRALAQIRRHPLTRALLSEASSPGRGQGEGLQMPDQNTAGDVKEMMR